MSAAVQIIASCRDLLARYDVLFSDVWGVVHDGREAYAGAGDAFARFRAAGGTVLLLSNAPMPSEWVARVLDEKGVRRDSWDAIVSSGDMTLAHSIERGFGRVHHIGTPRDLPLLERMPASRVPLDQAEAIVCTGLVDDRNETAETYRPLLEIALARSMPLLCANPDLIVDVGGELLLCAGVIAELYEEMGGGVFWGGKPYLPIYEHALETVSRLRDAQVPRERVLAIGDAMRTDIAGAAAFDIDALFIGQGIHRDEVLRNGNLDSDCLARLLDKHLGRPVAAMTGVTW